MTIHELHLQLDINTLCGPFFPCGWGTLLINTAVAVNCPCPRWLLSNQLYRIWSIQFRCIICFHWWYRLQYLLSICCRQQMLYTKKTWSNKNCKTLTWSNCMKPDSQTNLVCQVPPPSSSSTCPGQHPVSHLQTSCLSCATVKHQWRMSLGMQS